MFGFKPLIKEKYDCISLTPSSELPKQQQSTAITATTTATKIIGQQDIIEFVDNALASPLTINVLFNGNPGTGKTLHLQRLREKLPRALYYDFSNTSGAGFIHSLIRKAQEEGSSKEMTLLPDAEFKHKSHNLVVYNIHYEAIRIYSTLGYAITELA